MIGWIPFLAWSELEKSKISRANIYEEEYEEQSLPTKWKIWGYIYTVQWVVTLIITCFIILYRVGAITVVW
jgi:hypothetical protein